MSQAKKFGKWRSFFWPVHDWELKKFLPMLFMFFLIAFNYNLLRSYKDSLVITANHSGAEIIPFIKVWAVLPSAILLTFIYTRISNAFDREKVFYITISIFLVFFFLFAFVLYPFQEALHPHRFADRLQEILPSGFNGLIAIFRNWTFSLFYVMAELWSSAIFTVLFWGFANEVTRIDEAKRYYGILATGGNIAGIFSGQAAIYFSENIFVPWLPYGKTAWDQSIFCFSTVVILSGLLTMLIFRWLNVHVLRPSEILLHKGNPPEKLKMSMRKNFLYLAKSRYLLYIALIVLGYNIAINLVEVVWKNEMKNLYPSPNGYNAYMGQVMTWMAVIATIAGLFTTTNFIRRFSWTACALIPLFIVGGSGVLFFLLVLSQQWGVSWIPAFFGVSPLLLSVTMGSMQNCLSRASKYTLFDATKEISFIPLSSHSKLKGKAAIDGVGSRLGKSGGSVIHQGLLLLFSSVASSTPYVAIIFLGVVVLWGYAVVSLGKQFDELTAANAKIDLRDDDERKPILA